MDANIESIKRNFEVNVFGLLAITQAFFPLLRAAKGMVVNHASIAGLPGVCHPYIGAYTANKSAVIDLSNTLRVELAPFDIKVCKIPSHATPQERLNSMCRSLHSSPVT